MASSKTPIIEAIFNERWNSKTKTLTDSRVTLVQVENAIIKFNKDNPSRAISTRNPANFLKDLIRNKKHANKNWPSSVFDRGYTARQVTGENMCFEFVPLEPDQALPFPIKIIQPSPDTVKHKIQSASMSLASRRLGRRDEAWLIQVLVKLNIIETHLAISSKGEITQVDFLQSNIKQSRTEIDALFLAIRQDHEGQLSEIIVSCEAKGRTDDILEDQIVAQVRAVFNMPGVNQNLVIPIAAKAVRPSEIHLVQFNGVTRDQIDDLDELQVTSEALYQLIPAVPGIGN